MLLAHYTPIQIALAHILPQQKFRLSRFFETNDPYEARFEWWVGRSAQAGSPEELREKELANRSARERISGLGFLSFCWGDDRGDASDLSCANNQHLWTYDASRSGLDAGCAMIFDSNRLVANIERDGWEIIFNGRLSYFNPAETPPARHDGDPATLFGRKFDFWRAEAEQSQVTRPRLLCRLRQFCEGSADSPEGSL